MSTEAVVLVTGAGSGIGAATVALFHERGHRVVAVDLHSDGLAGLAGLAGVVTLVGDVAEAETSTAVVLASGLREAGTPICGSATSV